MPESNLNLLIWKKLHQIHACEVCALQVTQDKIFLGLVTGQITYMNQQC